VAFERLNCSYLFNNSSEHGVCDCANPNYEPLDVGRPVRAGSPGPALPSLKRSQEIQDILLLVMSSVH